MSKVLFIMLLGAFFVGCQQKNNNIILDLDISHSEVHLSWFKKCADYYIRADIDTLQNGFMIYFHSVSYSGHGTLPSTGQFIKLSTGRIIPIIEDHNLINKHRDAFGNKSLGFAVELDANHNIIMKDQPNF